MIFLYILIGIIIGGVGLYLLLRNKLKATEIVNEDIAKTNKILEEKNQKLLTEKEFIQSQVAEANYDYQMISAKKYELKNSIKDLEETKKQAAESIYKQALEVSQNSYDKEIEKINQQLEINREKAKEEYLNTLQDAVEEFQKEIVNKQLELSTLKQQIDYEAKNVDAAVKSAQRQLEIEHQVDHYRLNLSNEDISEINKLREVLPYLRDKEPLNKVIYQVYYSKPYTNLVNRVVGQGRHTGIYKITNLENNMCYVGQSVDIAERWRQHIKRGVGAEAPTRNKLYPAMMKYGVENFTFEVIEECDRSKLDEREDYWQEFFHAKDFGYSIK